MQLIYPLPCTPNEAESVSLQEFLELEANSGGSGPDWNFRPRTYRLYPKSD